MYALPLEAVTGHQIHGTQNIDDFESVCRGWKLNQVSFQVQLLLLIVEPLFYLYVKFWAYACPGVCVKVKGKLSEWVSFGV